MTEQAAANTANSETTKFLAEGDTCWRRVAADRAAVLVDAADYFAALRSSLLQAQRSIFLLGWELNSHTPLHGSTAPDDRAPREIGKLLRWLLRRRPQLEIRILLWNHPVLYSIGRELFPRWIFGWRKPRRVEILLDSHLPLGASHHEKVVIVDDNVAYCGGMDLTLRRWDTHEHRADDGRRRDPHGDPYEAVHDVQLVVDGDAAAALAMRARERWEHAGGKPLEPVTPSGDCWPQDVLPDFERVPVGLIRTLGHLEDREEIREVERSTIAAIARAEKLIYIENQYVTAKIAIQALLARLRANPALEVVIVTSRDPHGWLEAEVMGIGRQRFMAAFREPHIERRIHFLYPFVRGADRAEVPVHVHAKVLVVDDAFLRIGSSNLNNRSMGFDTECDVAFEPATAEHRETIAAVRDRLIAEHWGSQPADVAQALASGLPVLEALGRQSATRGVAPLPYEEPAGGSELVRELGDPERIVTAEAFVNELAGFKRGHPWLGAMLWIVAAVALVASVVLLARQLPFDGASFAERVTAAIEGLRGSPWRVPLVLLAFVGGSLVSFPILALIGATVVALGPVLGFFCAAAGAMLAAAATFGVGRLVGRRALHRWLGRRAEQLERQLEGRGIVTVALIRKVPIAPFSIVNLLVGASGIGFGEFMAGTAIGMLPGIAAFAFLGGRVVELWRNATPGNVALVASGITLWIGAVIGLQYLMNRYAQKNKK